METIKERIEKVCGVDDLTKKNRQTDYVKARMYYIAYLRLIERLKYDEVCERTGRTRAACINAMKNFDFEISRIKSTQNEWEFIIANDPISVDDYIELKSELKELRVVSKEYQELKALFPLLDQVTQMGLQEEVLDKMNTIIKATIKNRRQ